MGTYLYIKTHNKTGLKYFGKTSNPKFGINPNKYIGSGIYWKQHVKKHGCDVSTEIVGYFDDLAECTQVALSFSKEHDIVNSPLWANLQDENGVAGAPKGHAGHKFTADQLEAMSKKLVARWADPEYSHRLAESHQNRWTDELRKKQADRQRGKSNPKQSAAMTGRSVFTNIITGEVRIVHESPGPDWEKGNLPSRGKKKPAGHSESVSKATIGKQKSESHCNSIRLSKQAPLGILIDHQGTRYKIYSDFIRKFKLDPGFLRNLDLPLGTRPTYKKLGIDYNTHKGKSKRELGFRFEQELS